MGGTVYIDRKDAEIRLDGSALAVYVGGTREGLIPLVPIDRVVVIGTVGLQTNVLHRLAREGIAVLFLSGKRQQFAGRLSGRLHAHVRVRLLQYAKGRESFALELARTWVHRKLERKADWLREAIANHPRSRSTVLRAVTTLLDTAEKVQDARSFERLRGLEGGAASAYFQALPALFPESLHFKGRERRPPRDPVNALLSLTYTLGHWEWVRACELIGLDPFLGFYHEVDYGRESLACDLLEPWRPLIDRWVWTQFRDRRFTARDFASETERPGCYLKKSARQRYYLAYEDWMGPLRSEIRLETEALARSILDGEDPLPARPSEDQDYP